VPEASEKEVSSSSESPASEAFSFSEVRELREIIDLHKKLSSKRLF